MSRIESLLLLHEGERLFPYKCTAGKTTVGVGRNLTDKGISRDESRYLLHNDIVEVEQGLKDRLMDFNGMDEVRQAVLIDMGFNLGVAGLMRFRKTLALVELKYFDEAADAMLQSKWAMQVGSRAVRLAKMMRTGEWPEEV